MSSSVLKDSIQLTFCALWVNLFHKSFVCSTCLSKTASSVSPFLHVTFFLTLHSHLFARFLNCQDSFTHSNFLICFYFCGLLIGEHVCISLIIQRGYLSLKQINWLNTIVWVFQCMFGFCEPVMKYDLSNIRTLFRYYISFIVRCLDLQTKVKRFFCRVCYYYYGKG